MLKEAVMKLGGKTGYPLSTSFGIDSGQHGFPGVITLRYSNTDEVMLKILFVLQASETLGPHHD